MSGDTVDPTGDRCHHFPPCSVVMRCSVRLRSWAPFATGWSDDGETPQIPPPPNEVNKSMSHWVTVPCLWVWEATAG